MGNDEPICVDRDIYPKILFQCNLGAHDRIITWAVKKDSVTWLAPLPSTCNRETSSLRIEIKVNIIYES